MQGDVLRAASASSGGRELETVGDGVLSVFESPSDAIAFATQRLANGSRLRPFTTFEVTLRPSPHANRPRESPERVIHSAPEPWNDRGNRRGQGDE